MLIMDNLKLKDLRKHYTNEIDAIKYAIVNELNRSHNMYGARRFLYIEEMVEVDNYFKVKVVYIDYFTTVQVKDTGTYFINKEVI